MIGIRALFTPVLPKALAIALLLATLAALVGCSGQRSASDEKKVAPIAQGSPKLQPLPAVRPAPVRPLVPSQGDCAPRYANGGKGTCINNQPCRGFGVRTEDGRAICTCYGRDGGCQEGQRCDAMRLACVPEKEPVFGRGDVD